MFIIKDNIFDLQALKDAVKRPEIWEKSTSEFWDDEHISEQMLNFHLDPNIEAASKTRETIEAETNFIIRYTGMDAKKNMVDLGCGPGLYVKKFAESGAMITGIDWSKRSIKYAQENVRSEYQNTAFMNMNYLDLDFEKSFDIATLIFYDFCVLSMKEQGKLLGKIHRALKDDGVFIFDVVTDKRRTPESTNVSICEKGGFWSPAPYIEILNPFTYEVPKTEGMQYTIIAENGETRVIRLFHRLFGMKEITRLLNDFGFGVERIYSNLEGEPLKDDSETFGIIARRL
jgi:Methylase involved in ubiquinone/menaquinone biosynthesis